MIELHPWQREPWRRLSERVRAQSVPHALLLAGRPGLGKQSFARLFIQFLLCEQHTAEGMPCGHCRSCVLYQAGTHPDQRVLAPLEPGKSIGIDQVREASRFLELKPQLSSYKAVITVPADLLKDAAANSFLKTLEEPSPGSVLVLVTARPAALPATILSRCQRLTFAPPPPEESGQWLMTHAGMSQQEANVLLALTGGAPLAALEFARQGRLEQRLALLEELEELRQGTLDISTLAERRLKIDAKETLYWMCSWVRDLIRLRGAHPPPRLINADTLEHLRHWAQTADIHGLYILFDRLNEGMRWMEGPCNTQLVLEDALIEWRRCLSEKSGKRSTLR